MHDFSVAMGLMDFVPVVFFAVSAVLLLRDLYGRMAKGVYALFSAGCINVFMAGFGKALWMLLYAAGICDFQALEQMFLPVNSLGLLFVGLALVAMLCFKGRTVTLSAAPVVIGGTMGFIMMMVVGLGGMCASLSILAAKLKKKGLIGLFAASFVCAMGMGYMSSMDASLAWVNWMEQGINTVSQGCLMVGVMGLHRAGLKDLT
ncbi:MAG: hypothetical protein IJA71_00795 [Clostridia bacterium]|nr:hypothetical protein [Clostridia bacterium]